MLYDLLSSRDYMETERTTLAPYAMCAADTAGRRYQEDDHAYRSPFQRDRDRVVHCTAFRRLEYKTQVYVIHEGDYYRTRLTHTLEVAQIARTMARMLRLNEDLTEAIALAHDLGHTPFGHSGEDTLQEIMRDFGGFEHNRHGLRVVEELEERHPDFPGLNLTYEVREGIIKHNTDYDCPASDGYKPGQSPTLEAQLVDLADEIAYNNHDLDDGLTAGLIAEEDLLSLDIWKNAYDDVNRLYPGLDRDRRKYQVIKRLINNLAMDAVQQTLANLKEQRVVSVDGVRAVKERLVTFSPATAKENRELKNFLMTRVYRHYRVIRMADKAGRFIKSLFDVYINRPEQLPPHVQQKLSLLPLQVVVCDYIAGMTDRYALDEYNRLFMPYERV
ncbi:MAG: deoxyguanosinetriphosphate triphosphohydrolase [bacterium]|nr:deoxyguanosinetriphosphate triphosphohydrolase [bacterium]